MVSVDLEALDVDVKMVGKREKAVADGLAVMTVVERNLSSKLSQL